MELNKRFWTEFIMAYHEQSCLWDVKSSDYSLKSKRNTGYMKLLKKLKEFDKNANIDQLRRKINNMRTGFRREFKKVKEAKRKGDMYEPVLWYYKLLLFTANDETDINDETMEEFKNFDNNFTICELEYDNQIKDSLASDLCNHNTNSFLNEDTQNPQTSVGFTRHEANDSLKRKSCSMVENPNGQLSNILGCTHDILKDADDEYQIAGKRIGLQLKSLNERQRFIAEKLISDVIYYAKMEKLTENSFVKCDMKSETKPIITDPK